MIKYPEITTTVCTLNIEFTEYIDVSNVYEYIENDIVNNDINCNFVVCSINLNRSQPHKITYNEDLLKLHPLLHNKFKNKVNKLCKQNKKNGTNRRLNSFSSCISFGIILDDLYYSCKFFKSDVDTFSNKFQICNGNSIDIINKIYVFICGYLNNIKSNVINRQVDDLNYNFTLRNYKSIFNIENNILDLQKLKNILQDIDVFKNITYNHNIKNKLNFEYETDRVKSNDKQIILKLNITKNGKIGIFGLTEDTDVKIIYGILNNININDIIA